MVRPRTTSRTARLGGGRIEHTQCCVFSADEGADEGTPVAKAYPVPFEYTGKIDQVTITLQAPKTAGSEEEAAKAHQEAALKKALAD